MPTPDLSSLLADLARPRNPVELRWLRGVLHGLALHVAEIAAKVDALRPPPAPTGWNVRAALDALAAKVDAMSRPALTASSSSIDDAAAIDGLSAERDHYRAALAAAVKEAEGLRAKASTYEAGDLAAIRPIVDAKSGEPTVTAVRRRVDELTQERDAAIARAEQAEAALSASLTERARLTDALANVERERAQAEESEQRMGEARDNLAAEVARLARALGETQSRAAKAEQERDEAQRLLGVVRGLHALEASAWVRATGAANPDRAAADSARLRASGPVAAVVEAARAWCRDYAAGRSMAAATHALHGAVDALDAAPQPAAKGAPPAPVEAPCPAREGTGAGVAALGSASLDDNCPTCRGSGTAPVEAPTPSGCTACGGAFGCGEPCPPPGVVPSDEIADIIHAAIWPYAGDRLSCSAEHVAGLDEAVRLIRERFARVGAPGVDPAALVAAYYREIDAAMASGGRVDGRDVPAMARALATVAPVAPAAAPGGEVGGKDGAS